MTTEITQLAPGLLRLRAANPSPMTFSGTNSYLLRGLPISDVHDPQTSTGVALIDPGPEDHQHAEAILRALLPNERISHIFVTHAHLDHSPLARPLAQQTGAKVYGFGPASAGRSAVMARLAATANPGGGEGVDHAFRPDITLRDGETVHGDGWSLTALHTPGHFCNHMSFVWGDAIFSGDHIMGWSSTLISPPDGDLADYYSSLEKTAARGPRILYPGHGEPVPQPLALIAQQRAHREARTAQILDTLKQGPMSAESIARQIYTEIPAKLLPAATRNTLAHLIDLTIKNKISHAEPLQILSEFRLS